MIVVGSLKLELLELNAGDVADNHDGLKQGSTRFASNEHSSFFPVVTALTASIQVPAVPANRKVDCIV